MRDRTAFEPLADRVLRHVPVEDLALLTRWPALAPVKAKLQAGIPKFVFDARADAVLAELITKQPRLILRGVGDLRPPYSSCWIECGVKADHVDVPLIDLHPRGNRSGMLVNNNELYGVTCGWFRSRHAEYISRSWATYLLDTPSSRSEQAAAWAKKSNLTDWRTHVFGLELQANPAWQLIADEDLRRLLDTMTIDYFVPAGLQDVADKVSCGGEIILMLGCLLLLNTRRAVRLIELAGKRTFVGGHSRQIRPHINVTLDVSPVEAVRYIQAGVSTRRAPQNHGVRGHFAHNEQARGSGCVHHWTVDDQTHWHCTDCFGRRWWVTDHERGSGGDQNTPSLYTVTRR